MERILTPYYHANGVGGLKVSALNCNYPITDGFSFVNASHERVSWRILVSASLGRSNCF
jgi:hypothetical protein